MKSFQHITFQVIVYEVLHLPYALNFSSNPLIYILIGEFNKHGINYYNGRCILRPFPRTCLLFKKLSRMSFNLLYVINGPIKINEFEDYRLYNSHIKFAIILKQIYSL
jgi:hypothetical protein